MSTANPEQCLNWRGFENYFPPFNNSSRPFPCPICLGKCVVTESLYTGFESTAINKMTCKTCGGKGIVWE